MRRFCFLRCIGELSKKTESIAKDILVACGIPFFLDILNTDDSETVNASGYVIQVRRQLFRLSQVGSE